MFLFSLRPLILLLLLFLLLACLLACLLVAWSVRAQRSGARPLRFLFRFLLHLRWGTTCDVSRRTVGAIALSFFSWLLRFSEGRCRKPKLGIFGFRNLEIWFCLKFAPKSFTVCVYSVFEIRTLAQTMRSHGSYCKEEVFAKNSLVMNSSKLSMVS